MDSHRASSQTPRPPLLALALAALVFAACGKDEAAGGSSPAPPMATPGSAAAQTQKAVDQATGQPAPEAASLAAPAPSAAESGKLKHREFTSDLFLDAPEHRDPFAPFETPKLPEANPTTVTPLAVMPVAPPEHVAFPDLKLEDLQCKMILAMRGEKPRAYLLSPGGDHEYVVQGDHVGQPIRTSATAPDIHWRVYEIQEGGVSFELSSASAQEGDTGVRPALRLYSDEEMKHFENLFSLR